MAILIIVLRIIHIFSGVFWVGFAFFNIGFLQPTVKATGAEGQKTMLSCETDAIKMSEGYEVSPASWVSIQRFPAKRFLASGIGMGYIIASMLASYDGMSCRSK